MPAAARASSITPSGSLPRRAARWRVRGSRNHPAATAITPTGTLTKKIHRQPAEATSSPPATGPSARPSACAAAWIPSAARRRPAGALVATSATLLACSIAAPAACTTRSPTSTGSDGASPHAADARGEHHEPVQVHQLAAVPVRPAAHRHQQRHQRQQVGQRHPLHPGQARAELALQRGERQRHDAGVELAHERPEAHRGHRQPRRQPVLTDHGRPGRLAQQHHLPALRPAPSQNSPMLANYSCRRLTDYFCRRTVYSSITERCASAKPAAGRRARPRQTPGDEAGPGKISATAATCPAHSPEVFADPARPSASPSRRASRPGRRWPVRQGYREPDQAESYGALRSGSGVSLPAARQHLLSIPATGYENFAPLAGDLVNLFEPFASATPVAITAQSKIGGHLAGKRRRSGNDPLGDSLPRAPPRRVLQCLFSLALSAYEPGDPEQRQRGGDVEVQPQAQEVLG